MGNCCRHDVLQLSNAEIRIVEGWRHQQIYYPAGAYNSVFLAQATGAFKPTLSAPIHAGGGKRRLDIFDKSVERVGAAAFGTHDKRGLGI